MNKIIQQLLKSKFFPLKSQGSSMLPILRSDDVVYFKKTCLKNLKINDLVLVKKNHQLFTHRIIYKTDKHLVTKGDNNLESDGKIYPHQIIGKVAKVKRDGKEFDPNQIYLLQSSLYFQEIIKIKSLLEKQKINFVFLKGLPLHLYYEKTHPRRIYADCDILVKPQQKNIIDKILIKLGFQSEKSSKYSHFQTFIGTEIKEKNYFKKINNVSILLDIHYQITFTTHKVPNPFLNLEESIKALTYQFFERKTNVTLNRIKFPILEKDDLMLYLLLHFFTHLFNGVYRLDLINKIYQQQKDINWRNIFDTTAQYKILNFIIPSLYLLDKYYNTKTPFFMVKKTYPNNFSYSMIVFKMLGLEKNLFDNNYSFFQQRLLRALLIFLYTDENIFKKTFIVAQPKIILHLIYFLLLRIKWKLFSFFSGRQSAH